MMQHIASTKSEPAAAALPLNTAGDGESKQAFNSVMKEESQRISTFNRARQNSDNVASKQHDIKRDAYNSSNADKRDETSRCALIEQKQLSNRESAENQKAIEQHASQKSEANKNDSVNNNTASTELISKHAKSVKEVDESIENSSDEYVSQIATADNNSVTLEQNAASNTTENFDYVNYVSQIAIFTGNQDIAEKPVTSVEEQDLNLQVPITGDTNSEGASAPNTLSLNKQELQTILDLQNANLDLNTELSEENITKLENIVASMLNLLDEQKTQEDLLSDNQVVQDADRALMMSLLISKHSSAEQAGERSSQNTQLKDQMFFDAKPTGATSDNKASLDASIQLAPSADLNEKLSTVHEWAITPDLTAKQAANDVLSKPSDTAVKSSPDMIKTPLQNIVAMDEEQTTQALKNVNERVQLLVQELQTPNKGTEFIAALQAGVKEFKQQLSDGREPGIDLKALVADAIASTNTEVTSEVQPKLDAALNQFNAVLNLANAVNYSATQQQAQVLGMTDIQFAKELNNLQTEGTKLANAVDKQLNAHANGDKAINIFKSEGQQQLAEKVRWMVNSRNSSAEIRLDPPDLGGINIKVNLSGDTAQVNFSVQSMAAKEALDQAVPRLRDMLAQQGIELGQSSVNQESQQQQSGEQQSQSFSASNQGSGVNMATKGQVEENITGVIEQRISNGSIGGIDYYA